MLTLQMSSQLLVVLCLLLAVNGTHGLTTFGLNSHRPTQPKGVLIMGRNEPLDTIQATPPLKITPRATGLQSAVTFIHTTVVTLTETTVLPKMSIRTVTVYPPAVTITRSCMEPPRQDGDRFEPALDKTPEIPQLSFGYPVYKPTPNKPVDIKPPAIKPVALKPADIKPTPEKPIFDKPIIVKPTENKPASVENNPVLVQPAWSRPAPNPSPAVDAKPFLGVLPILSLNPAFGSKPATSKPEERVESNAKPLVESSEVGAKPIVDTITAVQPTHPGTAEDQPNSAQDEFLQLMAEFTTLMDQLIIPSSQAALSRRFHDVTTDQTVWKRSEMAVHYEALSDDLRLLVKEVKEVQRSPQDFYEHLETFVSYMEELW